ncbi:MAG: hypothetical protein PHR22_03325 [Candidatus Omnitrophica bacterium]|nr:hypothetical protein [Candidatus Omnitrophota bacterium]
MKDEFNLVRIIEDVAKKDLRYPEEAYFFVLKGLNFTVAKLDKPRHVTGQELSDGMRLYAIEQFGPMSKDVLEHWGITRTEDFGNIVFNLIEVKLLAKTETDSIEDFKNAYDFKKAFARPVEYKIE